MMAIIQLIFILCIMEAHGKLDEGSRNTLFYRFRPKAATIIFFFFSFFLLFILRMAHYFKSKDGIVRNISQRKSMAVSLTVFRYSLWFFSGLLTDGGCKKVPFPKICHTYPTMMKLGTVRPYLKKTEKIYESRDTTSEFCWHQHFFTWNQ